MDLVGPFSDCKKAHFAFHKTSIPCWENATQKWFYSACTRASSVWQSLSLPRRRHVNSVGLFRILLRLLLSNVGRMQTILPKCNSQIALHARRTVGPCHKTWGEQVGEPTTACHILLHVQIHTYMYTCIHILLQKQVKLLTLITPKWNVIYCCTACSRGVCSISCLCPCRSDARLIKRPKWQQFCSY